jgi:hypothetical protein
MSVTYFSLCVGARARVHACVYVGIRAPRRVRWCVDLPSMQSACALLSSATSLAAPYFSHYLINGTNFGRKLLNLKCVFLIVFYNFCLKYFSF